MAGFKKRLNESLQLKLSFNLLLAILLIAIIAGVFSFLSAFDEAHELQDDTLLQIAVLFDQQHLPVPHLKDTGRVKDSDEESRVIVQYLVDSKQVATNQDAGIPLPLPANLAEGLQTLEVNGEPYRVLVRTISSGERIAVAQETGVRNEIAHDSALRTLTPFLILIPILLLLVANLVSKMFQPIAALSAEVDQRAEQELHAVEISHFPTEVRPFAIAINQLLARVNQAMEAQQRFVADAAHELRSPLTALSLQAERLADAEMSDLARERLITLRRGIERGRNLLDQLLTLAKAQVTLDQPQTLVSVQQVYRQVLEDLLPLAEAKHMDIGVEGEQDAQVWVNELELRTLVKNLVDNAIRYTPEGGKVDLSVTVDGGSAQLRIQDSGLGIPLAEQQRVFDPFYRALGSEQTGSGLGLSIVKAIAERMGAQIQLGFTDPLKQSGLAVSVTIPLAKSLQSALSVD